MRELIPENAPTLGMLIGLPVVVAAFIGIICWVYSRRRKDMYEAASRLPLNEDGSAD